MKSTIRSCPGLLAIILYGLARYKLTVYILSVLEMSGHGIGKYLIMILIVIISNNFYSFFSIDLAFLQLIQFFLQLHPNIPLS